MGEKQTRQNSAKKKDFFKINEPVNNLKPKNTIFVFFQVHFWKIESSKNPYFTHSGNVKMFPREYVMEFYRNLEIFTHH